MVIEICQRELELMTHNKVVVARITIRQHIVHLIVERTVIYFATVADALDPYAVSPLQIPGTRIHVTRQ